MDLVTDISLTGSQAPPENFELERTSLGLIFRDQFNRVNLGDIGSDYVDTSGDSLIKDNKYQHTFTGPPVAVFFTGSLTANRFPTTGSLNLPTKYMVQGNVSIGGVSIGNFNMSGREGIDFRTGSVDGRYEASMFHNSLAVRRIMKFFTGSNVILASSAFNAVSGTFYGERLMLEDQGDGTLAVSGAWTLPLSSSTDLRAPFTDENLSALDAATTQSETNVVGFASDLGSFMDEYIVQGTEVIVTDLPSGFKARLDDDAAVAESGGTVRINVKTRALPFAIMSVLNADNEVVAQISPQSASLSDGWGGDVYALSGV